MTDNEVIQALVRAADVLPELMKREDLFLAPATVDLLTKCLLPRLWRVFEAHPDIETSGIRITHTEEVRSA